MYTREKVVLEAAYAVRVAGYAYWLRLASYGLQAGHAVRVAGYAVRGSCQCAVSDIYKILGTLRYATVRCFYGYFGPEGLGCFTRQTLYGNGACCLHES